MDSRSFRDSAVKKPYSPKALPTKKCSTFSGIRSKSPRSSHPVQYHGTHTRTRGGRLRELRIRFYSEQRILRKVFEEWKEEWWISHQEWKLCVRADCHYRYYLYNLMFQKWKTYVHQQQEMRSKYISAENHDAKQKMRQIWKSWLVYVVVRRTKVQMQTTALEFRQQSILWVWWSKWKQRLRWAHMNHTLHTTAVKHRALSLQLQAWSRWQEQLLHSQRERQKAVSAVRHHQHWQKRKSFKAWFEYLHIRRVKRQQNEMAVRFYRATVLQIHFCDWQWAWEWRQSLSAHQALVEELARRMVLRRAFTHWKHYVLLCAEEAAQCEVAEEHHRHHLLYFCFRALKDNVTCAHRQRIRRNLAHQQHDIMVFLDWKNLLHWPTRELRRPAIIILQAHVCWLLLTELLRRFWNRWQAQIEQKEEREQLPLLHAAWGCYRVTLLCKCIRLWLRYTQKRRYKQLLQTRADGHFQQRALPTAFHIWSRLWRWHQQECVLNTRAARFHRETLEKQVFALWWQKMFQHRENRLAERMAVLQAEQQLLRRCWCTWHQQAAARHQEREWHSVACAHHNRGRLRKAFCIWRESARGLRTERMGRARAVRFHSARLLLCTWSRWRECLALRVVEQRKVMRADLHGQRAMLHRALRKWLMYHSRMQSVLQEVAARESQHNRELLQWVLHCWRRNTVARVNEARKTSQAIAHYRRTLCSKVLVQWQEVASVEIYYRQQEAGALREAQKVLDRGRLRCWFWRWWERGRRVVQQRAQLERAAQHHRCQQLLQALEWWKAHHRGCVRKRLLQKWGAQLLAQRLSRACFHQWRQQLAARRQEQQSTVQALWFWAFSLQAKAWAAWRGFVLERRRKEARLARAAQAYNRGLLREGAARLLHFAACTKAFRQQLQAQQQAQAAHSLHRAVRRCAELWKQKVLGPGQESRSLAPTVSSRRVTFEGPLLDRLAAGAGDATLETQRLRAPRPQGALGCLALATGELHLPELNATRSVRKQPRRPHFLLEPVQSQKSPGCGILGDQGPEKPQGRGQGMAHPAGPFLPRPFLPGALPSTGGLKLPPTTSPGPDSLLLPPSSFLPRGAGAPARMSAQPTTPGPKPQGPPSLASGPDSHLLLPGDFTATRAGLGHDSEATGHTDLEAELEEIQQQLQQYQTTKQNLRSYQRQANSLRRWLELSQEEHRPEDQDAEQQVQKELEEVELQIWQLAEALRAQRQPVGACIARIQALRQALC